MLSDELQRAEERASVLFQTKTIFDFCNGRQDVKRTIKWGILAKFLPFSDERGLVRIKGRIRHANLSFKQRPSILLSTKHEMLDLMLRDLHQEHNHEGVENVKSVIEQKKWILGLRNALRTIKSQYVFCHKLRAQTKVPFLAVLPREKLD